MVYLYMFLGVVGYYALIFILTSLDRIVFKGDEALYVLLSMIIGILVYIAETLDEKNNKKRKLNHNH